MTYTIRNCFILLVIVPLITILFFASWIGISNIQKELELRMKEEVELVARSIRYSVANALHSGRIDALESSLFAAIDIRRIYGIYVYTSDGELLVSAGPITTDDIMIFSQRLRSDPVQYQEYVMFNNQIVYSHFEQLTNKDDEKIGYLQIVREKSGITRYIDKIKVITLLGVFTLSIILGGILIIGYKLMIGIPMKKILDEIYHFDLRTPERINEIHFPQEFLTLSKSLNDMINRISDYQVQVKEKNLENRELETKLSNSKKMAAIGELAAGVAHDIGNPMSVADAMSQKLLRQDNLDEKNYNGLLSIREEIDKMKIIVNELLNFSSYQSFNNDWCKIDEVLIKAINNYAHPLKKDSIRLDLCKKEAMIDYVRFEQVFLNFFLNSKQVISEQKEPRISVKSYLDEKNFLVLEVCDSGPGVEEELQEKIFEVFYTKRKDGKGTGLGLAICSNIVETYGGEIKCLNSTLGGACFRATFDVKTRSLNEQERST